MSTTTSTYALVKHARGDTPWDVEVNANYDSLDTEIGKPRYPFTSPTVGATTTLDLATARSFVFTVSQATTIAFTNVPSASFYVPVELVVSNGSAFAITWPASVSWLGGIKPTFKAAGVDLVDLATKDGGVTWYASLRNLRPGVIYQNQALSTTSTTEVSIASYSLPAGTLAVNGQALRITATGNDVTQNGVFKVVFGATTLVTASPTPTQAWTMQVYLVRTGATAQLAGGVSTIGGTSIAIPRTLPAETLSGAVLIDFRGSVTSGGTLNVDIVNVELVAVA